MRFAQKARNNEGAHGSTFHQSRDPRCRHVLHLLSASFLQTRVVLTADTIRTELFHVAGVSTGRLFLFWNIFMVSTHWARLSSKWKSVLWWTWPMLISPALCSVTLKSASPLWFGFPSSVQFCTEYSMLRPPIHSHNGGSRILKMVQRQNVQI